MIYYRSEDYASSDRYFESGTSQGQMDRPSTWQWHGDESLPVSSPRDGYYGPHRCPRAGYALQSKRHGILGYSSRSSLGGNILDLIGPTIAAAARRFYRQQIVRQQPSSLLPEFPVVAKNGRGVWLGQHVRLVIADGRVTGFDVVARDISSQEQAQQDRETTSR